MALQANSRTQPILLNRNERVMPKWVTEQSDRVGPKPPPPPIELPGNNTEPALPPKTKTLPEPDYEVIEFSNQQYSNAPLRPPSSSSGTKTPDSKLKCTLCGSNNPWVTCDECAQQIFCASCDDMFHKHPKRKNHMRKTLEQSKPPLPPKAVPGQPGPLPPIAPPRRNKRGLLTPLMQRKDQVNSMKEPFMVPSSPILSTRNDPWHERMGSLKRGLSIINRPLPETPKSQPSSPIEDQSSRSETPKSAFDNIQRPPSVALERIKSKANATLDRMQLLQQRYRQQKEQIERERSGSTNDQNHSTFDLWSSISPSPSHFRSGSISSGINSSHLDLRGDSHFNLFRHRQMQQQSNAINPKSTHNQLNQRGLSTSVFNLHQAPPRKSSIIENGWVNNPMQQAQSMAQLNCANCTGFAQQPQWIQTPPVMPIPNQDPWGNQLNSHQHLNRSNLSLNIPSAYMMHSAHQNMYPPPVFMNQRNLLANMYPQAYMEPQNQGLIGVPPPISRVISRPGSRMASPALSRQSVTLRRKQRAAYFDDEPTDDEDSDEDDRRSLVSNRSGVSRTRQKRLSNVSQIPQLEDDFSSSNARNQHRMRVREQRRGSTTRLQPIQNDWASNRRASTNNGRSVDSGFNSPLKSSRIYSDLDSEGSGTRALVQAKIEQKLKEDESLKQKQSKTKRRTSNSPSQKSTKQTTAVQTPAVKSKIKEDSHDTQERQNKEEENHSEVPSSNHNESENQSTHQEEDTKSPIETEDADKISLGPPPSTPDHEWECEFCTFVNEPNIKICSICCKTPSTKPKKAQDESSSPPKQIMNSLSRKDSERENTIKKKSESTENNTTNLITDVNSLKINAKNLDETDTLNKKESIEDIWATLDENIQTTAQKIKSKVESQNIQKVSVGAGTPSKRENIEKSKASPTQLQNTFVQAHDDPTHRTSENHIVSQLQNPISSKPTFNDTIQHPIKVNSIPKTTSSFNDYNSFEAEVLSNIHHNIHTPNPHPHMSYARNDRQRYLSTTDLRSDDLIPTDIGGVNGLRRRQPSINDLMLMQRGSSQLYSPTPSYNFDPTYPDLDSQYVTKEADLYKYTPEELNAALKYCGPDTNPLIWLRDHWPKLITTVQTLATKYGQERVENTIGTISQVEARDALRLHTGNIWQAVSECIEQRQRKYRQIASKGNFSREDIVTALTIHQGNEEIAVMDLSRTQLKPFLMRIWGSPSGVENESIAIPNNQSNDQMVSSKISSYSIRKDIHDFLSANASDCMQIPNATGAYLINNQSSSQPHNSSSVFSSYENDNNLSDNISNYSADKKNLIPSYPLQIDESILSNKSILKDLETLIGNMELQQQKQSEQVLQSTQAENDFDPEIMRVLVKSPIAAPKVKIQPVTIEDRKQVDIKNFMWEHIQEIMPNLVQQVEKELMDEPDDPGKSDRNIIHTQNTSAQPTRPPPPVDHDEFLMEEVIKPGLKNASIKEEVPPQYVYVAEIATFKMEFDKALEKIYETETEFDSLENCERVIFKMYKAPDYENFGEEIHSEMEASLGTYELKTDSNISNNGLEIPKTNKITAPLKKEDGLMSLTEADTPKDINRTKSSSAIPISSGRKTPLFDRLSHSLTPEPSGHKLSLKKFPINKTTDMSEELQQILITTRKEQQSVISADEAATTDIRMNSKTDVQPVKLKTNNIKSSKIPIRSSTSSKSKSDENERKTNLKTNEVTTNSTEEVEKGFQLISNESQKPTYEINNNEPIAIDEDEVYSIKSEISSTGDLSQFEDNTQSPTTVDSEMFLMIQDEQTANSTEGNSLVASTSNSTLHSLASYSSGKQASSEFLPSGDPSKQNLSELVKDTQRLIKQMKDEISIADFESSGSSEDDYTDDYTDEYDDGEGEEELGEEEEGWEDEDEYEREETRENVNEDNIDKGDESEIENMTSPLLEEEETVIDSSLKSVRSSSALSSILEQSPSPNESIAHTLKSHTPNEESQLALFNRASPVPSRSQSQSSTNDLHNQELATTASPSETQDLNVKPTNVTSESYLETENTVAEMPVEYSFKKLDEPVENVAILLSADLTDQTHSYVETENNTPEVPMEALLNLERSSHETSKAKEDITVPTKYADNKSEKSKYGSTTIEDDQPSTSKAAKKKLAKVEAAAQTKTGIVYSPSTTATRSKTSEQTKLLGSDEIKAQNKKAVVPSKIPKPQDNKVKEQKDLKKKINTRSKSFSGPPTTPIGITSVKTLRQEILKQTRQTPATPLQRNPPPPLIRKKSITEVISKLTKPTALELTSSHLFKPRTQPRIPKKKYHETCFSDDDYESSESADEEPEPLEIRQRKLSVPVFRPYPNVQQPEEIKTEELIKKFVEEQLVSNLAEAQIAAALISMKFQQDVSIWAAKECSDLDHAIGLLRQECELCSGTFALNEIVSMLKCTHKCCKGCAKKYFTVQITERSINDCNCPFCKLPELHKQSENDEDEILEYFSNLDIFLKNIVEAEVHELFHRKLRDRTLLKDPNFKWCIQCSSGFFARPKQKRLICPDCGSVTCAQCRKLWQKQHENITCEQFLEWQKSNDPDVQTLGVQRHLEQNGIDCPKCKFRYSLARGGCMHFTCTQCKYEFCYGCARPFMMGAKCNISPYCAKLGLHAHHPRNCLFYLRDKLPIQLQILLKNHGVNYEEDPIDTFIESNAISKAMPLRCPIPIQKETPTGLVDTKCNNDVPEKHGGMCRTHYVEYLTAKVAKANIDPLPIFDLTDCVQELRRRGISLPERGPWDTDEIYKNMCAEVIKQNIPLDAV
ncbi:linear Ubiquitin E3 ligase isoform 1-T3 [Glossina fuscipes fuscipes]